MPLAPNPRRSGTIIRWDPRNAATCASHAPRESGNPWMKTRGGPDPSSVTAIRNPLIVGARSMTPSLRGRRHVVVPVRAGTVEPGEGSARPPDLDRVHARVVAQAEVPHRRVLAAPRVAGHDRADF